METTRNKRVPMQKQIKLINECCRSGLTDADWRRENGIAPSTFYNWISRCRKVSADIREPHSVFANNKVFEDAAMPGDIACLEKIYIVCGYTDMRKSINGFCAIVEEQLKLDAQSSSLFLFCGRHRDRIKALYHKPDGFVLIYKRLSVAGGYQWPRKQSEVRDLTWREFD